MEIKVVEGRGGENSPSNEAFGLVVVTRGRMSRTGRQSGGVWEGYCVQVTVRSPVSAHGYRTIYSCVRLYARDRWNPTAINNIGDVGAYCSQKPSSRVIEAEIERAKAFLLSGGPPNGYSQLRIVECTGEDSDQTHVVHEREGSPL